MLTNLRLISIFLKTNFRSPLWCDIHQNECIYLEKPTTFTHILIHTDSNCIAQDIDYIYIYADGMGHIVYLVVKTDATAIYGIF